MTIDKIKKIVSSQLNVPAEKITEKSRIVEDLGADSLDIMEMLVALEEEFKISIPDEDTAKMRTIEGIVQVIDGKIKA